MRPALSALTIRSYRDEDEAEVLDLFTDPAERERMGSTARERSLGFDIRAIAPMYLALYEELL